MFLVWNDHSHNYIYTHILPCQISYFKKMLNLLSYNKYTCTCTLYMYTCTSNKQILLVFLRKSEIGLE